MKKTLSYRKSNRVFRKTHRKVKKINLGCHPSQGGFRF